MKKKISELILQIIPVMIGVYLGFAISNWGDQQKRKSQSIIFFKNIKNEIEINTDKLQNVIDYHKMLKDSSRFYFNNFSNKPVDKLLDFFKGIQTSTLIESAYNTGNQTGIISELEMNKIQNLNQLYAYQKEYNEYIKMTLSSLINSDFEDNEKSVKKILQFISITMTDIIIKEELLITEYNKVRNEIKTQ